jgi:hypothetical protein
MKTKWRIFALTLIFASLGVSLIQFTKSQDSMTVVKVVPSQSSVRAGDTLNVNLTISNVQNLYALDLTLGWNISVLQLLNVNLTLGVNSSPQPHPEGVLYGNQVSESIVSGDVYINASETIGEYNLIATSIAPADSFNGSGTIATLTFNVLNNGHSSLILHSDLADHPEPGETTSESIVHNDVSGSVDVSAIPEFPEVVILALLAVCATAFLVFSKKILKKTYS